MNWIKIDNWNSVALNEYKGHYSIVAGYQRTQDSDPAMNWVAPFVGGEPKRKDDGVFLVVPQAVRIGDSKDEAIMTLKKILNELDKGSTPF